VEGQGSEKRVVPEVEALETSDLGHPMATRLCHANHGRKRQ